MNTSSPSHRAQLFILTCTICLHLSTLHSSARPYLPDLAPRPVHQPPTVAWALPPITSPPSHSALSPTSAPLLPSCCIDLPPQGTQALFLCLTSAILLTPSHSAPNPSHSIPLCPCLLTPTPVPHVVAPSSHAASRSPRCLSTLLPLPTPPHHYSQTFTSLPIPAPRCPLLRPQRFPPAPLTYGVPSLHRSLFPSLSHFLLNS